MIPLIGAFYACAVPPQGGVLSLHDTTTEIVVGLGRADRLGAITEPHFLSDAAMAAVAGVPRLSGGPLSREALLAQGPTAVLGTDVVPEQQPELLDLPGALWIDPQGLDGLWASIRQIAAIVDADPEPYIRSLQAQLPEPIHTDSPVPIFFFDCCEPPFTAGGRAPLNEIAARLGGVNIFADLDQDWGSVSWEAVIARKPSLVVIHDYTWAGQTDLAGKKAILAGQPALAALPEVAMPLALALEGPRVVESAAVLGPAIGALR